MAEAVSSIAAAGAHRPKPTPESRKDGAGDGNRTRDLRLGRPPLLPTELLPLVDTVATPMRSLPMAIRAHDIALGGLGQDRRIAGPADERRHVRSLAARIPMIKVHRARRISTATVRAGHVAKLIEHRRLASPACPLCRQTLRGARCAGLEPTPMLRPTPHAVAVGANDVTLGHLRHDPSGRHEHGPAGGDGEGLLGWIPVVEVHLVRLELTTTIGAWDAPEVTQQLDHARLSNTNAPELDLAVPPVVLDVVCPLAGPSAHAPV